MLGELTDKLKRVYYFFEDRYYALLDKIDKKIPIYGFIDKIDAIVPSFFVILLAIFLLLFGVFSLSFSNFSGQTAVFVVVDENDEPLDGLIVNLREGNSGKSFTTDAFGEFSAHVSDQNIYVTIEEEGFNPFMENIFALFDSKNEIKLEKKAPEVLERFIEVKKPTGEALIGAKIEFSCSSGIVPPRTIDSSSSTESVKSSASCGVLSAIVTAAGYKEKRKDLTGTRTVILMELQKTGEIAKLSGSVAITVEDATTKEGVSAIDLKLYNESGVWVNQGQSGEDGVYVFSNVVAGTYYIKTFDTIQARGYISAQSENVTLTPNSQIETTISISKPSSGSSSRKIAVKFIDKATKNPVAAVAAQLYDGNVIALQIVSGASGEAEFPNLDANKTYAIIAGHEDYVLKVTTNLKTMRQTDSNFSIIELEAATIANSGTINVSVKDAAVGLENADVQLYSRQIPFYIANGSTSNEGAIVFKNMPAGEYYAKASTLGQAGTSANGTLAAGEVLALDISLVLQEGSIEVEVVDIENNPVEGAKVEFFDSTAGLLGQKTTKQNGKTDKQNFKWNIKPYLVVSRSDFLASYSLSYSLVPKQTVKAKIVLRKQDEVSDLKCDAQNSLCIGLVDVLKSDRKVASSIAPNSLYILVFEVKAGSEINAAQAVIRSGLNSQLSANDTNGVIRQVRVSPPATSGNFSGFNPADDFDFTSIELAPADAKAARINFTNLKQGVYTFEIDLFIKPSTVDNTPVEVRYGIKGTKDDSSAIRNPASGLFLETYLVNKPLECDPTRADCENFIYVAKLSEAAKTHLQSEVTLDRTVTQEMKIDAIYTLNLTIFNSHRKKKSFPSVPLRLTYDSTYLEISPPTNPNAISIDNFQNGTSYSIDFTIKPLKGSMLLPLSISLGFPADETEEDNTAIYKFKVAPKNRMSIALYPEKMTTGSDTAMFVELKDSITNLGIEGASVVWSGDSLFSTSDAFAYLGNGVYTQIIPSRNSGEKIYIKAQKAYYEDSIVVEREAFEFTSNFTPVNFDCVKLETIAPDNFPQISITRFGSGNFTLRSNNCERPIEVALYVPSASLVLPAGLGGPITLKNGPTGPTINQCDSCASLIIPQSGFATITALGDKLAGQYDVYVKLRYSGDVQFRDFGVIEVTVNSANTDLFSLDNAKFDIFDGQDSGFAKNKYPVDVIDIWYPKLTIDLESAGKYDIGRDDLAALLPITFDWTVTGEAVDNTVQYITAGTPNSDCENCSWICSGNQSENECNGAVAFNIPDGDFERISKVVIEEAWFLDGGEISLNGANVFSEAAQSGTCTSILERPIYVDQEIDVSLLRSGDNTLSGMGISNPGCNSAPFAGAKIRIEYEGAENFVISQSNTSTIAPEEGKIYDLGSLSGQNLEILQRLDPTTDFIELNVDNSSNGLVETWIEGTALSGMTIKARYIGANPNTASNINFRLVNRGFTGTDYALLGVTDYVDLKSVPDYQDIEFVYTIEALGTGKSVSSTFNGVVRANGIEKDLGLMNPPLTGNTTYIISDNSENISVYFKNTSGSPVFSTTDALARVYARSSFNITALKNINIVFLLDISGGMGDEWSTVCSQKNKFIADMKANGFNPTISVYGMGRRRSCSDQNFATWGDSEIQNKKPDSVYEAWGATAQQVIDNYKWGANTDRILVIAGDNDPSGRNNDLGRCSPYVEGKCYWRKGEEEKIVDNLIKKANAKQVSLYFWHPTNMEARATELLEDQKYWGSGGGPGKNDAIELMEYAARKTNGTSETYARSLTPGSIVDRFILVIMKSTQEPITQYFHIRADAGKVGVCYGPNDIEGLTGNSFSSRLLPSWSWNDVHTDSCDFFRSLSPQITNPEVKNSNYVYCDSTQFTTEVMKKMNVLIRDVEEKHDFSKVSSYLHFNAYLMADGYSDDFLSDYSDSMTKISFFDTPDYFANNERGLKNLFAVDQITQKRGISFTSEDSEIVPLPATGLYDIGIELKFGSAGQWVFFSGGKPNFEAVVNMELIEPLESKNLLYYMPIDGIVGATENDFTVVDRIGYGSGFSGDLEALKFYKLSGGEDLTITASEGAPIGNVDITEISDFTSLNQDRRTKILTLTRNGAQDFSWVISKGIPTPVILKAVKTDTRQNDVPAFYTIKNGAVPIPQQEYLSLWSGIASDLALCVDFSGNSLFRNARDAKYNSLVNGPSSCGVNDPVNSYGFYWPAAATGELHFRTVLYTPTANYNITNACRSTPVRIITPGTDVSSAATPVPLDYGKGRLEMAGISDLFNLVKNKYVCVSERIENGSEVTEFWWNEEQIHADLANARKNYYCNLDFCTSPEITCSGT